MAATIGFHALLLLAFLLYKIITPIPPYPEDGGGGLGVELSFGDSQDGMGFINPELLSAAPAKAPAPQQEAAPVMTSEIEEEAIEPERPKPKKQPVKELKRPEPSPKITKTEAQPIIEKENTRALYPGKKGGSEGQTGKPGNQGSQEGDPYARYYEGRSGSGGEGGDGTGSGGGTGSGNGTGTGTGNGPGISFKLDGRGSTSLPKPAYTSEKSGRVVVDIQVDQQGNVVRAKAGGRGTTVQDSELFRQAESAARRAKFKPSATAPEVQIGTITYNFIRN